jgi:3-hydroxyacyl-[acyl-carrier-protein] dehydratase
MKSIADKMRDAVIAAATDEMQVLEPDVLQRSYCFGPDFIGFQGHFPGYPILPAIVQVLIPQTMVEEKINRRIELKGVVNAKFLSQINPDQEIVVRCQMREYKGGPGADVRIVIADDLAASFRIRYLEQETSR